MTVQWRKQFVVAAVLGLLVPLARAWQTQPLALSASPSTTHLREVRYAPLTPGPYQFEVQYRVLTSACSGPAVFAFTGSRVWRARGWALALQLLVALFLLWGIIHLRTRALERDRRRLEEAVALRSAELARANRELEQATVTDPLTNISNRRFFNTTIGADASQSVRAYSDAAHSTDHRDLIFYLVDIDHFKEINDMHGHHAGDAALIQIAQRLGKLVRRADMLIRWGGEEFLVVSRSNERKDAPILAERILAIVGSTPLQLEDGKSIARTCSVGWAAYPWKRSSPESVSVEEVLTLVDRALSVAKDSGRNQAVGFAAVDEETEGQRSEAETETTEVDHNRVQVLRLPGPKAGQEAADTTN
jgi:diguanylate cyclase (GGDEF)-like protein